MSFSFLLAVIYAAFISLGLPDAMLGSAWPSMQPGMGVPVSYAGLVSMIISVGTIISSIKSDWLTKKFGTGKVTAVSVGLTALALFGFSATNSFWGLCLIALPYGLGAGAVDAALNNYVALHYEARHMSWLHCFWGIGASTGPYIMGACLNHGLLWNSGYRIVGVLQVVLTAIFLFALPLWKKGTSLSDSSRQNQERSQARAIGITELFKIRGAKPAMISFFCYCALEQTAGLWGASYMVMARGLSAETAAWWAALYYMGITAGRFVSGFITMKLDDKSMVRLGQGITVAGILLLFLPLGNGVVCAGLIMAGIGCAPIYPSLLHETPQNFGAELSQAVMGLQMACAYIGSMLMPPLFGLLGQSISISLYPVYLFALLLIMIFMTERLNRQPKRN